MSSKYIKSDHIKLYKRENSKYWQMKIKLPKQRAIRLSTGTKTIKEAEQLALKNYLTLVKKKNIQIKNTTRNVYKKIHLVETAELKKKEIEFILDEAIKFISFNKKKIKKNCLLEGRTIFNLFFEDSTRTRTSFEVAAKRLSADIINVAVKDSSINKGETLLDTMTTINSMNPDVLIIRHPEEGISKRISMSVDACVINAGDGSHEHPTQALLDALTIKNRFKKFSKLQIAICGDILHSRVARSNIIILSKLGAKINVIGPQKWLPKNINSLPVKIFTDMKKGLKNCDIVMMLRIQKERIFDKNMPNKDTYFKKYGLDYDKLKYAKKNAFVMHPGPMNRGVEINSKLADDITRSLIQEQVAMGVAIRMACLDILIRNKDNVIR
ncbi:aspartate carbamoyltransferase catalytic subunit [Alphaproteobacteria bacterium]|nr:aspartate carbamoyltransferase catalytic subunit [Alphaproteobacteria bacterium]